MMVRRTAQIRWAGAAAALTAMVIGGCTATDAGSPVPTPVPTRSVDAARALCGLDPESVDAVTGLAADTADDDFVGHGAGLRGECEIHSDDGDPVVDVVRLTVYDAASETCVGGRDIVEGRGDWPDADPFESLDGGVWAQIESSDEQRPLGPSTVAFVGDACISMDLAAMAPGRNPVREAEALTMQAIATLGLDGS